MELIDKSVLNFTEFEIVMCDGDFEKAFKLICEKLDDAPIIEAEPVRHGRWIHEHLASSNGGSYAVVRCSNCLSQYPMTEKNYCPNCGAEMRVEE